MKRCFNQLLSRVFIAALLSTLSPIFSAAETLNAPNQPTWKQALDKIGLLPTENSPYGAAGTKYLAKQIGRELTANELNLLKRNNSGKWKQHADGLLSFDLPDDPLLKVEVFEPEQKPKLEIVGGAVGSTDNHFQKVYRITFSDGVPYGLILVSAAEWFDEGICMCGPIDLKTLIHTEGNLLELSQLPDGAIKKSQVINGTHRAILFEWTHSSITQSAYARIAASLRFEEKSQKIRDEWIAYSQKQRGFEAGLGWLYPATTLETAMRILGDPTEKDAQTLTYKQEQRDEDGRGARMTYVLDFPGGKLAKLRTDWSKYEDLSAPRGSLAWAEDTMRIWNYGDKSGDPFTDKKPPKPEKLDVELMLKEFHKNAPTATDHDWAAWVGILADLKRLDFSDEKAAHLVLSRSTDMNLPHHQTRWVLELYEMPEAKTFVKQRLRYLLDLPPDQKQGKGEINNLYASVDPEDEEMVDLLRQGISSPDPEFQKYGVSFIRKLPKDEARSTLEISLHHEDPDVRHYAILNVQHLCTKDDEEWLNEALKQEPSEENRKLLDEKISQLK